MVDSLYKKAFKHIFSNNSELIAFISCFAAGICANIFLMTNKLWVSDSLNTISGVNGDETLGRWLLNLLGNKVFPYFGYSYANCFINTLICIIFISFSALIFQKIFKLKSLIYVIITSCLLVLSPAHISHNLYFFTSHFYGFAYFLCFLGVYLIIKNKSILFQLFGIICFILSLSLHQSYFTNAICLFVLVLIDDCIVGKINFIKQIKKSIYYLLLLIIAIVLYSIINHIFIYISGTNYSEHVGIGTSGIGIFPSWNLQSFCKAIVKCYGIILLLPFKTYAGLNITLFSKIIIFMIFIVLLVVIILTLLNMNIFNKLYFIIAIIVLPLSTCSIKLMTNATTGIRMTSSIILFFVFACLLFDKNKCLNFKYLFFIPIFLFVYIINLIWTFNDAYNIVYMLNNSQRAYMTEVVSNIYSLNGYKPGLKTIVIGGNNGEMMGGGTNNFSYILPDNFNIVDSLIINPLTCSNYARPGCFKIFGAYNYVEPDIDKKSKVYNSEIVKKMPIYPEKGAIDIVDNTVVIKAQ